MNIYFVNRASVAILAVLIGSLICGCSERLARENVFANTETNLGLSLAQNAKTQLYEVKMGYFRHELFFVPTSKTITYNDIKSNSLMGKIFGTMLEAKVDTHDPSTTPEVLAEIAVGASTGSNSASADVRQRLAVGKTAVLSPSALALMANDAESAKALSTAAGKAAASIPSVANLDVSQARDDLVKAFNLKANDKFKGDFDTESKSLGFKDFIDLAGSESSKLPSVDKLKTMKETLKAKGVEFPKK